MLMTLTLLSLVFQVPYGVAVFRRFSVGACIPNSQFHMNGRLCHCDAMGRWNEASCEISRRQKCNPGQIVWEGCTQCICQENGHMLCSNTMCREGISKPNIEAIDVKHMICIPFISYYMNCSLCVCPASGNMNEARCANDATCPFRGTTDYVAAVKNNVCIPKVMYLFPCLQCLCSDDGYFIVNKCADTCEKAIMPDNASTRTCPKLTFYRKGCNVCFCPVNGIANDNLCTKAPCVHQVELDSLVSLSNKTRKCQRQMFTEPKCFYCECKDSTINESACLESKCMSIDNFQYDFDKTTCSLSEMVPRCMECFCPHNGYTDSKYCTNVCFDDQKKLSILEIAVKDIYHNIIDRKSIETLDKVEDCVPNTIYKTQGKYCVCPENGDISMKLCTTGIGQKTKITHTENTKISVRETTVNIDFNIKCDPNTFVEFDCNTCYCLKPGRIDPKWCTYDDCESKRIVLEKQKSDRSEEVGKSAGEGACVPGSISKLECNFCICPESGELKDRACTKNGCVGVQNKVDHGLSCDPLSYYNVDCNTCYCPKNGVKNVAQCTKTTCEKNFLRTEVCVPGRLFSEECNVCVCPPNGNKFDRVCTNNTCADANTPWKTIFQMSQSLLSYQKMGETTRNLELCFPGEEFEIGCKVCLCPDMGLRIYATCTQMLCNDEKSNKESHPVSDVEQLPVMKRRSKNDKNKPKLKKKHCFTVNATAEDMVQSVKECTPGSMYFIKCQQCICPYMGSITSFCRPLPIDMYCEQAFPKINYMPMGRRIDDKENATSIAVPKTRATHAHTAWSCSKPGRVADACFVCDCADGVIIQEHCFKSEDSNCTRKTPTFLVNKLPGE